MGGVRAIEDSSSPQSGVALEIEYQQLHAALSEKADNLELTELKILTLWSMWEGKSFDGLIDYPNDFTVQSVEKDLSSALKVRELPVNSERFNKELQKKVVRLIMPKLSGDAREAIFKEIENFTGVN